MAVSASYGNGGWSSYGNGGWVIVRERRLVIVRERRLGHRTGTAAGSSYGNGGGAIVRERQRGYRTGTAAGPSYGRLQSFCSLSLVIRALSGRCLAASENVGYSTGGGGVCALEELDGDIGSNLFIEAFGTQAADDLVSEID